MNLRTADQSIVMSLIERSVDGRNFVVPAACAHTSVLRKELRRSLLKCVFSAVFRGGTGGALERRNNSGKGFCTSTRAYSS